MLSGDGDGDGDMFGFRIRDEMIAPISNYEEALDAGTDYMDGSLDFTNVASTEYQNTTSFSFLPLSSQTSSATPQQTSVISTTHLGSPGQTANQYSNTTSKSTTNVLPLKTTTSAFKPFIMAPSVTNNDSDDDVIYLCTRDVKANRKIDFIDLTNVENDESSTLTPNYSFFTSSNIPLGTTYKNPTSCKRDSEVSAKNICIGSSNLIKTEQPKRSTTFSYDTPSCRGSSFLSNRSTFKSSATSASKTLTNSSLCPARKYPSFKNPTTPLIKNFTFKIPSFSNDKDATYLPSLDANVDLTNKGGDRYPNFSFFSTPVKSRRTEVPIKKICIESSKLKETQQPEFFTTFDFEPSSHRPNPFIYNPFSFNPPTTSAPDTHLEHPTFTSSKHSTFQNPATSSCHTFSCKPSTSFTSNPSHLNPFASSESNNFSFRPHTTSSYVNPLLKSSARSDSNYTYSNPPIKYFNSWYTVPSPSISLEPQSTFNANNVPSLEPPTTFTANPSFKPPKSTVDNHFSFGTFTSSSSNPPPLKPLTISASNMFSFKPLTTSTSNNTFNSFISSSSNNFSFKSPTTNSYNTPSANPFASVANNNFSYQPPTTSISNTHLFKFSTSTTNKHSTSFKTPTTLDNDFLSSKNHISFSRKFTNNQPASKVPTLFADNVIEPLKTSNCNPLSFPISTLSDINSPSLQPLTMSASNSSFKTLATSASNTLSFEPFTSFTSDNSAFKYPTSNFCNTPSFDHSASSASIPSTFNPPTTSACYTPLYNNPTFEFSFNAASIPQFPKLPTSSSNKGSLKRNQTDQITVPFTSFTSDNSAFKHPTTYFCNTPSFDHSTSCERIPSPFNLPTTSAHYSPLHNKPTFEFSFNAASIPQSSNLSTDPSNREKPDDHITVPFTSFTSDNSAFKDPTTYFWNTPSFTNSKSSANIPSPFNLPTTSVLQRQSSNYVPTTQHNNPTFEFSFNADSIPQSSMLSTSYSNTRSLKRRQKDQITVHQTPVKRLKYSKGIPRCFACERNHKTLSDEKSDLQSSECGHLYCSSCITTWKIRNCLKCKKPISNLLKIYF